jgi:hypothetical protein
MIAPALYIKYKTPIPPMIIGNTHASFFNDNASIKKRFVYFIKLMINQTIISYGYLPACD